MPNQKLRHYRLAILRNDDEMKTSNLAMQGLVGMEGMKGMEGIEGIGGIGGIGGIESKASKMKNSEHRKQTAKLLAASLKLPARL